MALNILFWVILIIYIVDNVVSTNVISYVGKTTKEFGKNLDNTKEITKKVKEALIGKSALYRRLLNAYPKIQAIKVKIKEKKDKYIIEMDLPGYEKENINLSLRDGYLEVTAEVKKEDDNEEKDKFVHKERYYGHCSRSFYVGEQIKEEDVNAEFKNSILKICITKKEERKELPEAKHIEIK